MTSLLSFLFTLIADMQCKCSHAVGVMLNSTKILLELIHIGTAGFIDTIIQAIKVICCLCHSCSNQAQSRVECKFHYDMRRTSDNSDDTTCLAFIFVRSGKHEPGVSCAIVTGGSGTFRFGKSRQRTPSNRMFVFNC